MKFINSFAIIILLYTPLLFADTSFKKKSFKIFDATAYSGKPDIKQYGIKPIEIAYVSHLYPKWPNISANELPSRNTVLKLSKKYERKNVPVVIDIEHWKLRGDDKTTKTTVENYTSVLQMFKYYSPNTKYGIYGVLPTIEYYKALEPIDSPEYKDWQKDNTRLFEISNSVNYIFPAIYAFNFNKEKWIKYATSQLREAKQYNKPVYAFIWPQIHESNILFSNHYVDYDFWMAQLETIYQYADGVVIWGGHKKGGTQEWDENADWWRATKHFISVRSDPG